MVHFCNFLILFVDYFILIVYLVYTIYLLYMFWIIQEILLIYLHGSHYKMFFNSFLRFLPITKYKKNESTSQTFFLEIESFSIQRFCQNKQTDSNPVQDCVTRPNPMNRLKKRSILYMSQMQLISISQRPEFFPTQARLRSWVN